MPEHTNADSLFASWFEEEGLIQDAKLNLQSLERGHSAGYRIGFDHGYLVALQMCLQLASNKTKNDFLQSLADKIEGLRE